MQLTYIPQDYQAEFHATPHKFEKDKEGNDHIRMQIIGVFGGYGSAKSTASLHEVFLRCLENPRSVTLITAPTLQLLKRTSIKTLLDEIIPPPLLESFNKSDMEFKLVNGHSIYAIPSDDEGKLRSINAGQVHMEESSEIKRTIYDQLLTRLRNKNMTNRALFACSNPELTWIKTVIVDNEKRSNPKHPEHADYADNMICYIWKTELNKYLPHDFIATNSKGKPEWWVRKYMYGSFEATDGAVYPEFGSTVIPDIPEFDKVSKGWTKMFSLDHGLRNPTVLLGAALNPNDGCLYIYHEYYKANTLVPKHAEAMKPVINAVPSGLIWFMVADPSIRNKTDPINGKSVLGLYQEYNLYFSPGNNDIETGLLRVNSYIERGKLKVFESCFNLIREMSGYRFPEVSMDDDKNLDEKPLKKDDHAPDALRYMLMRLPEDPDDLKQLSFSQPDRYSVARPVDYDPDFDDDEVSDDYLSYV
jgi:PBSX family phage terminase large subunit